MRKADLLNRSNRACNGTSAVCDSDSSLEGDHADFADRYDDESQRSASRGELGAGVLNGPLGRTMAGRRNRPVLPPLQSISKFVKRCRHPKHHASRCGVLHCLGDRSDFSARARN